MAGSLSPLLFLSSGFCSQSVALVIDGIRHREFQQSVRVSLVGEDLLQLLLQRLEVLILLIFRIIAPYI